MKKTLLAFVSVLALLVAGACSTSPPPRPQPQAPAPVARPAPVACPDCGRVLKLESVNAVRATEKGGVVLGGVVGGVLSKPSPGAPATAASASTFRLLIAMDDGRRLVIHQASVSPRLAVGSRVKLAGGRVLLLR